MQAARDFENKLVDSIYPILLISQAITVTGTHGFCIPHWFALVCTYSLCYMRYPLLQFLLVILCLANDERVGKAEIEATESYCEKITLAASVWLDHVDKPASLETETSASSASFSRQAPAEEVENNGENIQRSLAMSHMPTSQQRKRNVLWYVWISVGTVLGQELCPQQHPQLHGEHGPWSEMAAVGSGLVTRLGSEAEKPKEACIQQPEKWKKGRWEAREAWETDLSTQSEMANSCPRLLGDQGRAKRQQEDGSDSTESECNKTCGTIARGAGAVELLTGELPRRPPSGCAGQGGSSQKDYHDRSKETYWPVDKSEEGPGQYARSETQAHASLEEAYHQPSGEHKGSIATVSTGYGRLRELRVGAGCNVRQLEEGHPADEDMKAIKEVDSGLLAGGADMPIDLEAEETPQGQGRTEVDADDMNRLQESFMECIAAAAEGKRPKLKQEELNAGDRARSRSRGRGEAEEAKDTIRKDL